MQTGVLPIISLSPSGMFLFLSFFVLTQYNIFDSFDTFRTILPSSVQFLFIYSTFDHFEFLENCVTFDCVVRKTKNDTKSD